ncbi:MAG: O-antigen ligase family protein [Candidatus Buchananbacteria bacterium]|nr:O-antigen ligase family protein [Candidatus Buchananbacteria bacterium]
MRATKIHQTQTKNITTDKAMSQAALSQKALNPNSGFNATYSIMAYLYIGCFIILGMTVGFSPIIYGLFLIVSLIFILPSHLLGIYMIIFMTMIFERWFSLSPLITDYSLYKLYPLDVIMIITFIGWLIDQIKNSSHKLFFGLPEKILATFIVVNFIYLIRSFFDINADAEVAFSSFKNYAFYPLLYFLVIYSVQTKKQFKNVMHLILLAGVAIISFIIIGLMRGEGLWTEYTPLSTSGVRFLAGTHAFYLMIATLIGLSLLAFDRLKNKGFISLIIIIWLGGIVMSLMRHLWLSLFVGLTVLLALIPLTNRKNLIRLSFKSGTILITLIAVILLSVNLFALYNISQPLNDSYQTLSQRIISIASGSQDTSINWRINFWNVAKKSWIESPVTGLGFGQKLPLELGDWQTFEEIRNIHNSPLAITIQMGLIGIGLFIMFILTNVVGSLRYIFKNEELKPYYFSLLAGAAAILFASLFQPYLETNLTGIFLWIILGLLRSGLIINSRKS